jgi:hypothetical protein
LPADAAVLFGALENPSAGLFALTAVEIAWELSLAIYLVVKGFRPSPILSDNPIPALRTS